MGLGITARVYAGFGIVLLLVAIVAGFGTIGLMQASDRFVEYRKLARQTVADGRVQANMLMTRIFAKNFVIDANDENIEGVRSRAEATLQLIEESRALTTGSTSRALLTDDMKRDLQAYVSQFDNVTKWQATRNDLVLNTLNVIGPKTEQALTQIMTSALEDGDTIAAYEAGVTLRSLLLGRLYAFRFLIENDDASADRAMREFRDMELNIEHLLNELENPERRALAEQVKELQGLYIDAFIDVRHVIGERNILIKHHLDRIGPEVADRIERLKLAIKEEQDRLGPAAQDDILRAEALTIGASVVAIIMGIVVATLIGRSVSRPIQELTLAAEGIAEGKFDQQVDTSRQDELGTLARAFVTMRSAIDSQVNDLKGEIEEREKVEQKLEKARLDLEATNADLENKVAERTAALAVKEEELRQALANMSDAIYMVDGDMNFRMYNAQYLDLLSLPEDLVQEGASLKNVLLHEAEQGFFGEGDSEALAQDRLGQIAKPGYFEQEGSTPDGRVLDFRKSAIPGGGAVVIISDVTKQRLAERDLQNAFSDISSSIQYASRIQSSILPSDNFLDKHLESHFVYWRPRDVVGGDIYWCRPWGDGILIMLGDCTGHGVPGAFMTLISTGALEQAMAETPPGAVSALVGRMHNLIRDSLQSENGDGAADDGLELAACYLPNTGEHLTFVGAHLDLYRVKDTEIEVIKGGRKGLGYREIPPDYHYGSQEVPITHNARFYMATDGLVDQIGAENRKRFGKRRFMDLLKSLQEIPLYAQEQIIDDALNSHQGSSKRIDDVSVIGFSVDREQA